MKSSPLSEGNPLSIEEALIEASRLLGAGELPGAKELYQEIVRLDPQNHEALSALGKMLLEAGDPQGALALLERAVSCRPDSAEARFTRAGALRVMERFDAAIDQYLRTLELDPSQAEASNHLGNCYFAQGKVKEACGCYQHALRLRPDYAEAHNNMGNVLNLSCDAEEALESYRKALSLRPELSRVHSNILLSMNYLPGYGAREIYQESVRWAEQHGASGAELCTCSVTDLREDRRLRVGYLSPDFCLHSVSFFCEPLFASHDRDQVEVCCYSDAAVSDPVTDRLKTLADSWCHSFGMSDQLLIERIQSDRIDLLVDLTGHTAMNRLALFARKPAPVQVTWLGYPGTTGLPTMDYRLTDAVADPEGEADLCHSESLFRLPGCFLCYAPTRSAPRVVPAPFLRSGFITFGSFNNLAKLTPDVLRLWAELLRRVPGSRLLLKNKYCANPEIRERLVEFFRKEGIAESRVSAVPALASIQAHLELYGSVDVSLDSFPYNGTTTTFESLWMGVPVVTLAGERHAGRVSASILTGLGLENLIATSPEQYLEIAQGLGRDAQGLAALRGSLRGRLAGSPLCDGQLFAGKVEFAYREMWRGFCRAASGSAPGAAP